MIINGKQPIIEIILDDAEHILSRHISGYLLQSRVKMQIEEKKRMLVDEIKFGESVNIEFKREVPQKSEKYIKSVIAFANTAGGKIVIGIDDETHEIVGVDKDGVFKIIDNITNTISDMCCPQIFPNIGVNTIDGKSVIVINIYPEGGEPAILYQVTWKRDRHLHQSIGNVQTR